jgi:hypothetical protein
VVDDNFLQPQPGTSASDHLVSAFVPLAALLSVALAYPRLRAGVRAAIAIPLGLLAGGIDMHPRQYERRVIAFFDDALLGVS